ncbi:MAG: VIT domain-containing protein [Kiritimatiellia bacterium]
MKRFIRAIQMALLCLFSCFDFSGAAWAAETLKIQRIGKVVDAQGICGLQPKLQERWTPLTEGVPLNTGDWLRTDPRGANALQVRLGSGVKFVLGPGSLVEMVGDTEIRLVRGELEIVPAGKTALVLQLPGSKTQRVTATSVFRVQDDQATELQQEPDWLKAFKGAVTTESMGALLAKVDGRDMPLTLGYHKVTVDIRDQIARTVIEESFVNHTSGTLEGVFHFPLPQDASISGFGMWIGNELVEADVVEKQRAREIYETILRERRDPGLLEWAGGNIFKARVFPIFGHSEKRIKITYTQVLPMKDGRYRYSYALQSEMLRQHPLRELAMNVRIHSALPIKSVACPTHAARISQTAQAAQVEFAAQEYTPTRDFEVEVETDSRGREAVLVPHRRGDDGYFLLLVSPPDAGGDWQRTLIPDGPPLDVMLVADTSASMDRGQREAQAQFIAALLGSLGAGDRCRLVAADVDCAWFRDGEDFAPAEKEIFAASEFLAARSSLGWTDLARTFSNVLSRATAKTLIIYVGDGIGTTGDANPVNIAQALKRLHKGTGTVHAVATGSSFEPGILKALAGMGGGSFRRIEGRNGPQTAAMTLLGEIAQPAIRDLAIEFKGLRAARIYPEVLPNVCAGQQQIVLGRYLPEGRDQSGEVVVSGMRDGKPVRFKAAISLKDAEAGNEFIPRLWARMHLDALLEQGQTQPIKDEIIALSEDYHIMTPYTSLLVLESDEDRERFKVKRRFTMRDGERFFAEGRDAATLELRQKQILAAGKWRQDLRRDALRELLNMGRDPASWEQLMSAGGGGPGHRFMGGKGRGGSMARVGGRMGAGGGISFYVPELNDSKVTADMGWDGGYDRDRSGTARDDLDSLFGDGKDTDAPGKSVNEPMEQIERHKDEEIAGDRLDMVMSDAMTARIVKKKIRGRPEGSLGYARDSFSEADNRKSSTAYRHVTKAYNYSGSYYSDPTYAFSSILPSLAPPPADIAAQPGQPPWTEDVRRIADSLLRQPVLDALDGGVEIDLTHNDMARPQRGSTYQNRLTILYSPRKWVSRCAADRSRTLTDWADSDTRGVLCQAMQLGRQRKAQKADLRLQLPGVGYFNDYSLVPLAQTFGGRTAAMQTHTQGQVTITLRFLSNPSYEQRLLIDPRRHVLLRQETWSDGKIMSQTAFEGFVEAAGCWWATKVTTTDSDGQITGVTTASIKEMAAKDFEKQYGASLPDTDRAIVLRDPMPDLAAARQADFEKQASFDDLLALISHYTKSQQWEQVNKLWQRAEALGKGKPGIEWMTDVILEMTRRNDELSKRCLERAKRLVTEKPQDDLFLSMSIKTRADSAMQVNERLVLHETLRPVYDRQPARLRTGVAWRQAQAQLLRQAGRIDEARKVWDALAREFPEDTSIQTQYVQAMSEAGELPAALQWIKSLLAKPDLWAKAERDSVRSSVLSQILFRGPTAEWLAFLEEWMVESPVYSGVHDNYLSALIRTHQTDKANGLITQWIDEGMAGQKTEVKGQKPEGMTEAEQARTVRLGAAVRMTLGQENYYGSYSDRRQYDERWSPLLAKVVAGTYRSPTLYGLANQIMQHDAFRQTKEASDLRRRFVDVLIEDAGVLGSQHVSHLVSWLMASDPALKDETWQAIGRAVTARWAKEQETSARHQIAQTVLQILRRSGGNGEVLAFLHRQAKEGPSEYRDTYARQLFDELRAQPWNVAFEDECFALLGRLSSATNAADRLPVVVPALYDLVDAMEEGRCQALRNAVPKKEELSRTEFQSLQRQKRSDARAGIIKRLADEVGRQDAALAPWLTIERLALAVRQKQEPRVLAGECRKLLGAEPAAENGQTLLQWHLADRALTTWACLAAMQPRDEMLAAPLITFLDKGIAQNPDSPYWKHQKYRLLVALDKPADLEKTLTAWVEPAKADNTWRVALGYLMAEQDRVQDAVRQFEAAKTADGLDPRELRSLADWYLALGQKDRHSDALIEALMAEEEYSLSQRLSPILRPWSEQREAPPPELDPETFNIFKALFRKSQRPQNYADQLREFYRYTRDFRLLECLAEGVLGHTAQQAYPFLGSLQGILNEVRDEATVDSIVRHLGKVRERVKTRVDQRALDFLELQAERRAAELANQPGPHAGKALAAMQRVFKGDWDAGERRLMADVLAGLGRIKGEEVGREQLRQLKELHACREQPAEDRLQIALRLAETLWAYERRDEALDKLEAALAEFREMNKGILSVTANNAFARFVGYLKDAKHFARAEQILQAEIKRPANLQQAYWLKQRLFEVYTDAIRSKATVALGTGQPLYVAELNLFLTELSTDDPGHRNQLIDLMCSFFRAAKYAELEVAGLREFAFQTFPKFLERETTPNNYHYASGRVADTLRDLLGAQTGLEFLIECFENEPEWVRDSGYSAWQRHADRLGQWREQVKDPGKLTDRLLRIVTAELRRDLRSRNQARRCLYYRNNSYFWAEKATNFLAVANEVWSSQRPSGAAAKYIGAYLRDGLNETARAIEMLTEALKADQLDEQGLSQLAQYQHELQRFEDSIPVLAQLVILRPDTIQYRTRLMRAYFKTSKEAKLRELLTETDKRFHEKGLWQEANIAALAYSCMENQLHKESVAYYKELIPLHQRTQPNRGIGNGTLSGYYGCLAQAHAALKQTVEAVEAASGAVVSWGANQSNRGSALNSLRNVLAAAPDLGAYVAHLDKQVQETGLDNPTVRQALGQVYLDKTEYGNAIRHLRLAAATQPNDRHTHDLLVQAYDRANDPEGAMRQLLASVELSRRDINLYRNLGDRMQKLSRLTDAERAYTSIVEMQPNESESHSMLAELRQAQNRWPEAIEQWQQVARIRALEPTGLLKLAEAQIHEQRWNDARQTIDTLLRKEWPDRYSNVCQQAQNLKARMEQRP